jgi:hypothetical protein
MIEASHRAAPLERDNREKEETMLTRFLLPALLVAQAAFALPAAAAFPDFRAKDLNGAEITAQSLRGQAVVYLIGFSHESRAEVEAWAKALTELSKRSSASEPLRVIQMPVLSGAGVWARPFVESGLTRKTPKAERANVMTSTDRDTLVKGLALKDPDNGAAIALVDAAGDLRLLLRGGVTDAKERELADAMAALRSPKPGKDEPKSSTSPE